jgi:Zn finger protein HypA/HybF involved in hydrogenase expression
MPKPLSIEQVQTRLDKINIDLLGNYVRFWDPIRVRFRKCGHVRNVCLPNVLAGHGCLECANKNLRLDQETVIQRFAAKKIELLGTYTTQKEQVLVRCLVCAHEWETRAHSLLHNHGCPKCDRQSRFLTQDEVSERCRKLGLVIVSSYSSSRSRMEVWCEKCGYAWSVMAGNISKGLGCPKCRGSSAEATVREMIEKLTGWAFPSVRPSWLRGRGKRLPLELDGFNEEHRVAFEYQGWCHYHPIYGKQKLTTIKRRDERKRLLCRRHGVLLIRVPYWKRDVPKFLETKLRKVGLFP